MMAPETSLYARLLGADWERLPERVRRMHVEGRASGRFTIRRGPGLLAALVGGLCRFPPAGEDIPTRLAVHREGEGQRWERAFGPHALATRQHVWPGQRLVEGPRPPGGGFPPRPPGPGLRFEQVGAWLRLRPGDPPPPRLRSPPIHAPG